MANRAFFQTLSSLVERLTMVEFQFDVGASGAVQNLKGSGVKSVTRVQAGVYKVQLSDSYNRVMNILFEESEQAGVPVLASTALTIGNAYTITTVGGLTTAQWVTLGVPVGVKPAVGVAFVAAVAGTGSDPSSAVAPLAVTATTNAVDISIVGDPQTTINVQTPLSGTSISGAVAQGGYFFFDIRTPATGAVADLNQGQRCYCAILLRNSAIKGKGE